jgi:protein SCO1/2
MNKEFSLAFLLFSMLMVACGGGKREKTLPILGHKDIDDNGDTIYQTIPEFSFYNQDSAIIDKGTVSGRVYVADFFFTSCPTICPKMKKNMLKVYETYKDDDSLLLLSHTIDYRHDSVPVLKEYSSKLGVSSEKGWHFLYGVRDNVYSSAKSYMVSAAEDERAPGGYAHSGAFVLIDQKGRIRGYYDGTLQEDTDELIRDISLLIKNGAD